MWIDEPTAWNDPAGVRWGKHYFNCPICQVHETDSEQDVFCATGNILRRHAVAEAWDKDRAEHLSDYLTMLADEHADEDYHRSQVR